MKMVRTCGRNVAIGSPMEYIWIDVEKIVGVGCSETRLDMTAGISYKLDPDAPETKKLWEQLGITHVDVKPPDVKPKDKP